MFKDMVWLLYNKKNREFVVFCLEEKESREHDEDL